MEMLYACMVDDACFYSVGHTHILLYLFCYCRMYTPAYALVAAVFYLFIMQDVNCLILTVEVITVIQTLPVVYH